MAAQDPRPTIEEIFQLLKRSSLPTVLVEGKDDIIFYRKIEEDLSFLNIDILPAGNKGSVLDLMGRLEEEGYSKPIAFVVDKDLWVHGVPDEFSNKSNLITTSGYSIENDLFVDGNLIGLLHKEELNYFLEEIEEFVHWYALSVDRVFSGKKGSFRTHPSKVLDDAEFFKTETTLEDEESYPESLKEKIRADYSKFLRGKSLLAILHRQLSKDGRDVKFSGKQLMAFGSTRKGDNFERLKSLILNVFQ